MFHSLTPLVYRWRQRSTLSVWNH